MMTQVLSHFIERLRSARVEADPFPHYYIEGVFPEDYYHELLRHLPGSNVYENLYEVTTLKLDHFRHRIQRDLTDGWSNALPPELQSFWNPFNEWFLSPQLAQAVLESFAEPLRRRIGERESWPEVSVEAQFIRHRAGYFLGPHSDLYTKLVVLLLYLAPDDRAERLGTSLYRPKTEGFTCPDSKHYPFEDFIRVKTAPYKPNSLLAFVRSDISFHSTTTQNIPITARRRRCSRTGRGAGSCGLSIFCRMRWPAFRMRRCPRALRPCRRTSADLTLVKAKPRRLRHTCC